jgi:Au+-exporting ATPase
MSIELTITGMTCQNCVAHVTRALKGVPGVTNAIVDLESAHARVEGSSDAAALLAAVEAAGYEAAPR